MGNISKTDAGGLDFDTQYPGAEIFIDAATEKSLKFPLPIRGNFYQIFRAVQVISSFSNEAQVISHQPSPKLLGFVTTLQTDIWHFGIAV